MPSPEPSQRTWLIDASIYVFRPWYTWSNTHKDSQGRSINAVLGFIAFVDDLLAKENPARIAFAFDESLKSSHRKAIYPDYKANRESAPKNLRFQFSLCRRYIRALGMVEAASPYYEGDDILATWAQQCESITVITADKDLVQLVRGQEDIWSDYPNQLSLDYKDIIKKFGVRPDQIADQLALAGDKSDNIPGVPGVGMAIAAKLLRYFDTIEIMLNSIDKIGKMNFRGAMKIQALIQQYEQQIGQYRQVTALVVDVPDLEVNLDRRKTDENALKQLYFELGKAS